MGYHSEQYTMRHKSFCRTHGIQKCHDGFRRQAQAQLTYLHTTFLQVSTLASEQSTNALARLTLHSRQKRTVHTVGTNLTVSLINIFKQRQNIIPQAAQFGSRRSFLPPFLPRIFGNVHHWNVGKKRIWMK